MRWNATNCWNISTTDFAGKSSVGGWQQGGVPGLGKLPKHYNTKASCSGGRNERELRREIRKKKGGVNTIQQDSNNKRTVLSVCLCVYACVGGWKGGGGRN